MARHFGGRRVLRYAKNWLLPDNYANSQPPSPIRDAERFAGKYTEFRKWETPTKEIRPRSNGIFDSFGGLNSNVR